MIAWNRNQHWLIQATETETYPGVFAFLIVYFLDLVIDQYPDSIDGPLKDSIDMAPVGF
jgi:hypothetical protein